MIDRHFQNPQPRPGGAHLHFEIPSVSLLFHPEPIQCVATDGAEWAHVGVANAIEQPEKKAGNSPRKNLLEIHAARFAISASPRSDHKILFVPKDRLDQ